MQVRAFAVVAMSCVSLGSALGCSDPPRPDPLAHPKYIVLIGLDTVRADHVGAYGSWVKTPSLDAFAAESVLFEQHASTAPWTLPAFASLFTGLLPSEHGCTHSAALNPEIKTVAEMLRDLNYKTRAFVAVDWLTAEFGMDQGFDTLESHLRGPVSTRLSQYQDQVKAFVARNKSEPFFLFVHYYDAHDPYLPPGEFDRMYYRGDERSPANQSIEVIYGDNNRIQRDPRSRYRWLEGITDLEYPIKQYAAGVSYVDRHVGDLIDSLKREGIYDQSLVIVTSDHGEHLTEHSIYFTHRFPYEETLHVPLMVHFPGGQFGGQRIGEQTSSIDIVPTLSSLLGYDWGTPVSGVDLMPAITKGERLPERHLFGEYGGPRSNVRSAWNARYRLVVTDMTERSEVELFDRLADTQEVKNIRADQPEIAARLRRALEHRYAATKRVEASQAEIDEDVRRRLEMLGYVVDEAPPESIEERSE